MPGRRPAVLAAVLATLAGVALTGCPAGRDQPRALEPLATATPTPTPTAEVVPSPETPAAVEQAVGRYYDAVTAAYATGDTAAARALVDPACPCLRQLDDIDALAARGDTIAGSAYTVAALSVVDLRPPAAVAEYTVDISAGVLTDRTGKVLERTGAVDDRPQRITLTLAAAGWRVRDVARRDQ